MAEHRQSGSKGRRLPHESRRPAFVAALIIIAGQTWIAKSLGLQPIWLLPTVAAILLATSVATYESPRDVPPARLRALSAGLIGVLIVANAANLILLVRGVFTKSALTPGALLLVGVALWVVNVAAFALAYWEIDAGGPEARGRHLALPDLVFPQQQADQQGLAPDGWQPTFLDYLYVSLTAGTAFSPTDAMPYSRRAKLVMGAESTISFVIFAMLVARAVNVARG